MAIPFLKETLMLKYLMTHRQTPQRWTRYAKNRQRQACRRSGLHSYRPLVEVLEDRTLLSFITSPTYAVGDHPSSAAVGDFNGDGIPDLAVANYLSDSVSVLLGKRDGTFQTAQSYAVGHYPAAVAVADFNGDGHLDLVV